jgi:hypothetical protein
MAALLLEAVYLIPEERRERLCGKYLPAVRDLRC